jgi:predicted nucleic acid-binding protein
MTLVDTSVWVDHLRNGNHRLSELLMAESVACHPMVIGELACGNFKQRTEILSLLHALPVLPRVSDDEIIFFIEKHRLFGRGLGLTDIHLLASCRLAKCGLWTLDKGLHKAAAELED